MTEKVFLQTFFYAFITTLVLSGLFWLIMDLDRAIAYALGGLAVIMMMIHNYKTTMKTAHKDPESLKRRAMQNYALRFVFYAIIAAAVYFRREDIIDMVLAFLGISTFKFVMMINFFVHRRVLDDEGGNHDA